MRKRFISIYLPTKQMINNNKCVPREENFVSIKFSVDFL